MKKKAFTLLEVIIVIIIIGVLASLALPRMFAVVEGARAAEAIATIATLRSAMERCYLMNNGTYVNCYLVGGGNTLDIEDPANRGTSFYYMVEGDGDNMYWACARRVIPINGVRGHTICFGLGMYPDLFELSGDIIIKHSHFPDDGKIYWTASDVYKNFIPK